jgi:hypothetical protein
MSARVGDATPTAPSRRRRARLVAPGPGVSSAVSVNSPRARIELGRFRCTPDFAEPSRRGQASPNCIRAGRALLSRNDWLHPGARSLRLDMGGRPCFGASCSERPSWRSGTADPCRCRQTAAQVELTPPDLADRPDRETLLRLASHENRADPACRSWRENLARSGNRGRPRVTPARICEFGLRICGCTMVQPPLTLSNDLRPP